MQFCSASRFQSFGCVAPVKIVEIAFSLLKLNLIKIKSAPTPKTRKTSGILNTQLDFFAKLLW